MKRLLDIAVLWLLVLALPVQGFAAVAQSSCAPVLQDVMAAAGQVQGGMQSHHHDAAESDTADSHSAKYASAEQTVQDDIVAATKHQNNTHANGKCSAAKVCCISIAMCFDVPELPAFPAASPVLASLSSLFSGHIPDGPRRPPKFFLV
jgi:hypothetical protein